MLVCPHLRLSVCSVALGTLPEDWWQIQYQPSLSEEGWEKPVTVLLPVIQRDKRPPWCQRGVVALQTERCLLSCHYLQTSIKCHFRGDVFDSLCTKPLAWDVFAFFQSKSIAILVTCLKPQRLILKKYQYLPNYPSCLEIIVISLHELTLNKSCSGKINLKFSWNILNNHSHRLNHTAKSSALLIAIFHYC